MVPNTAHRILVKVHLTGNKIEDSIIFNSYLPYFGHGAYADGTPAVKNAGNIKNAVESASVNIDCSPGIVVKSTLVSNAVGADVAR